MKKALSAVAATLFAAGLTGCPGGATVNVDYDHTAKFSNFHTFSFGQVGTDNPLNQDRVRSEVTKDLTAKGLQMVPSGGDLIVTAVGSTRNKKEYSTFYNDPGFGGYYYGGFGGFGAPGYSTTTVQNYRVGTLVLDMYSGESKRLLWRGVARRSVSDSSEARREELNAAIDKMLANFPPA